MEPPSNSPIQLRDPVLGLAKFTQFGLHRSLLQLQSQASGLSASLLREPQPITIPSKRRGSPDMGFAARERRPRIHSLQSGSNHSRLGISLRVQQAEGRNNSYRREGGEATWQQRDPASDLSQGFVNTLQLENETIESTIRGHLGYMKREESRMEIRQMGMRHHPTRRSIASSRGSLGSPPLSLPQRNRRPVLSSSPSLPERNTKPQPICPILRTTPSVIR